MNAFTVSSASVARCPMHRLDVEHYWSDGYGGCRCTRLTEDDFDARFTTVLFTDEKGTEDESGAAWVDFEVAERYPAERVWTVVQTDDGEAYSPGFHVVNRIAYLITVEPWTTEIDEVVLDRVENDEDGAAIGTGRPIKEPWCAWVNPLPNAEGLHVVCYVEEGEPGYYETTYTGDLDYCNGVAAEINKGRGITDERALAIVASSMAVQNRTHTCEADDTTLDTIERALGVLEANTVGFDERNEVARITNIVRSWRA